MPMKPQALDEELELYDDSEREEAERKLVLQQLRRKETMAKMRKRMRFLRGKPVIFGLVIGVVIGQVDELENVVIAHGFSKKNAKSRIRWARETTAKSDAVQEFDENANIDVDNIPVPQSRAKTPEMEQHERAKYREQIEFALAFSVQWAERQVKLAEIKRKQAEALKALDADEEEDEDAETSSESGATGPGARRR